jgi:hypothetical protein
VRSGRDLNRVSEVSLLDKNKLRKEWLSKVPIPSLIYRLNWVLDLSIESSILVEGYATGFSK